MTESPFQVKGSSIKTKVSFAREHFGEQAELTLVETLADAGVARVLEGGWYDFDAYDAVLRSLAEVCYGGSIERLSEVGAFSARQALSTTYQAFARSKDLESFLAMIPRLHSSLYSHGSLSVEGPEDGELRFVLSDMPKRSRADHHVSEGFFLGAMRLLGWPDADSRQKVLSDGLEVIVSETAAGG